MEKKIKIVILAGGKGKRMNGGDTPKVLVPVKGRPMIEYLLESVEKSGLDSSPVIVVGFQSEAVKQALGEKYKYAEQKELLGTGHAASMAEDACEGAENVMVLYGDHPLVSDSMIKNLYQTHLNTNAELTMSTIKLPDFGDWREFFYKNFSRIVRDESGKIIKSVEFKDASEEEKKILEVNPCYFCFKASWLWENIKKIKNENAQQEYYLTDLVKMAMESGAKIESVDILPEEGIGANSREELEILEKFV